MLRYVGVAQQGDGGDALLAGELAQRGERLGLVAACGKQQRAVLDAYTPRVERQPEGHEAIGVQRRGGAVSEAGAPCGSVCGVVRRGGMRVGED